MFAIRPHLSPLFSLYCLGLVALCLSFLSSLPDKFEGIRLHHGPVVVVSPCSSSSVLSTTSCSSPSSVQLFFLSLSKITPSIPVVQVLLIFALVVQWMAWLLTEERFKPPCFVNVSLY